MTNEFNANHQLNMGITTSAVSISSSADGLFHPTYAHDLDRALRFIQEHDQFLVVAHVNPDGDAISSTLAIGWLLTLWGKSFTMVNENQIPGRLQFMANTDNVIIHEALEQANAPAFKAVICVDCADYDRIGSIKEWITSDVPLLNIDHHPTNNRYGSVACIRDNAAATAEILFDMFAQGKVNLDLDVSTMLYTGLLTDTGGFRYSNTTPHVMAIASALLAIGVDGNDIADRLLEKMSFAQMSLIQKGLARLAFSDDHRIAWLYITPEDMVETGALNEDLEGLVNYPRNVEGVEVGLLFKVNTNGRIKVSMRSAGKVNVAEVAQTFGGGGHVRAAGCTLTDPLDDTIKAVLEQVKQRL